MQQLMLTALMLILPLALFVGMVWAWGIYLYPSRAPQTIAVRITVEDRWMGALSAFIMLSITLAAVLHMVTLPYFFSERM